MLLPVNEGHPEPYEVKSRVFTSVNRVKSMVDIRIIRVMVPEGRINGSRAQEMLEQVIDDGLSIKLLSKRVDIQVILFCYLTIFDQVSAQY
jgi:hypothetical protein